MIFQKKIGRYSLSLNFILIIEIVLEGNSPIGIKSYIKQMLLNLVTVIFIYNILMRRLVTAIRVNLGPEMSYFNSNL